MISLQWRAWTGGITCAATLELLNGTAFTSKFNAQAGYFKIQHYSIMKKLLLFFVISGAIEFFIQVDYISDE